MASGTAAFMQLANMGSFDDGLDGYLAVRYLSLESVGRLLAPGPYLKTARRHSQLASLQLRCVGAARSVSCSFSVLVTVLQLNDSVSTLR